MSGKLFDLKEWVTVPDAAAYLSNELGEAVSEADILRFSLDGHLTLSVYFANGVEVKRGKVVTHSIDEVVNAVANDEVPDDLNWTYFPKALIEKGPTAIHEDCSEMVPFITSLRLNDTQWITLNDEKVSTVRGVWDLPMFGGERLDVEHKCMRLVDGPSITDETLDGAFIWHGPSDICQILADFDDNEYQKGSKAAGAALESRILSEKIKKEDAGKLRAAFAVERKEYKEDRKGRKDHENFYPSGGLPEDAVYAVRTKVLQEFVQKVSGDPAEDNERPLSTRHRNTLLTVIAALCKEAGIDYRERGTAKRISIAVSELGAAVSEDTIRGFLSDIPEAVESRSK